MTDLTLTVEPHPLLRLGAFETRFHAALDTMPVPAAVTGLLASDAAAPLSRNEAVRAAVRDLLRHGGYKPTGRGKPASEYLVRAAEEGMLGSINIAVDVANAVSLHSGLPISVVDAARIQPPLRVAIAAAGESYVFNAAGHVIDVEGLLCLHDADGPCANAVKDAQRTKTTPETTHTLSLVWSCTGHEERLHEAVGWYRSLLENAGAETADVRVV